MFDAVFVGDEFLQFKLVLVRNGAPDASNHTTINRLSFGPATYPLQVCEVKLAALDFGAETLFAPDNYVTDVS